MSLINAAWSREDSSFAMKSERNWRTALESAAREGVLQCPLSAFAVMARIGRVAVVAARDFRMALRSMRGSFREERVQPPVRTSSNQWIEMSACEYVLRLCIV